MKVYSDSQPQTYQVIGQTLYIRWDAQEVPAPSMGEPRTQWAANEASVDSSAGRSAIIEAIISSKYSTGAEIATINNQTEDPNSYLTYQAFRAQAKTLADGWLNR